MRYIARVVEVRSYLMSYEVEANSLLEAREKAEIGSTESEYELRFVGVDNRVVEEIRPFLEGQGKPPFSTVEEED